MEALKIYVLEDEMITQEVLKECLEKLGYIVCGMAKSAEVALEEIQRLKPDIALLDINVKGDKTGVWLGEQLNIPFVYISAYNDSKTIRSAVKTQPTGYLIKPIQTMEVFASIEMAINQMGKPEKEVSDQREIVVKDGKKNVRLSLNDILYIKSEGRYIEIHLEDRRIVVRHSLSGFMDTLSTPFLVRVHGSFAINLKKVESFDTSVVSVHGNSIPISRNFRKQFSDRIRSISGY